MKTNFDVTTWTFTVTLLGDLISTAVEGMRPEINALFADLAKPDANWNLLQLDLSTAKMVDSVGLNFIITVLKSVQKRGAKMQVKYSDQNVHRTFIFTRLDKHLELVKI